MKQLEGVRPINALVPLALYTRLREVAAKQEKRLAEVVREALVAHLDALTAIRPYLNDTAEGSQKQESL